MWQLVIMAMMRIWEVRVSMLQWQMPMPMGVARSRSDLRIMFMIVVHVITVHMFVFVLERLVDVFMLMPLAQVQPDAKTH